MMPPRAAAGARPPVLATAGEATGHPGPIHRYPRRSAHCRRGSRNTGEAPHRAKTAYLAPPTRPMQNPPPAHPMPLPRAPGHPDLARSLPGARHFPRAKAVLRGDWPWHRKNIWCDPAPRILPGSCSSSPGQRREPGRNGCGLRALFSRGLCSNVERRGMRGHMRPARLWLFSHWRRERVGDGYGGAAQRFR